MCFFCSSVRTLSFFCSSYLVSADGARASSLLLCPAADPALSAKARRTKAPPVRRNDQSACCRLGTCVSRMYCFYMNAAIDWHFCDHFGGDYDF